MLSTDPGMKPDFPAYIDSSMRASLSSCQTSFNYSYVLNLAVRAESVHLVAGGAFARGIEVVRLSFYGEGKSVEDSLYAGCLAAIEEYGEFTPPPAPLSGSNKTLENVVKAIGFYFTEWPMQSDHIQPWKKADGSPAVEFSASLPLETRHPVTGDPIIYCGRFDMLGIYNDLCFIVDEKTTSQLGNSWLNNWKLRSQQTGYVWMAREYGYPVAGAIIRGISFLKNSFGSAEVIEYRPEWQIVRWKRQLEKDVQRAIQAWKDDDWDMSLDTACTNYGGCSFQKLCLSNNPEIWYGEYETRTWSPIKLLEE
jgi:PD-(D/E)XK nuclease superfamily